MVSRSVLRVTFRSQVMANSYRGTVSPRNISSSEARGPRAQSGPAQGTPVPGECRPVGSGLVAGQEAEGRILPGGFAC